MKYFDKDEKGQPFDIPNMYKVPFVKLDEQERTALSDYVPGAIANNMPWANPQRSRNNKQLFIVSFKCSRVDVFFLLENTGLDIKEGDIVIVEADRGQDLGTVQHANVSQDEARLYKKKYGEEQYKWLMMFSKNNNQSSVNPNAQIYGENRDINTRTTLLANAPPTMQGTPRDNFSTIKAKAIKRLASAHEIRMLSEKEGNEAKAKRTCQQKVAHLHLDMEILDAEWQWDFQKLIFYYYADHYINFKELITELYRIYKTRIWLSAINPASFSQTALGQPPSGIGPGAVVEQTLTNNQAYAMMYGADPDPYGAVPPYRIGFDTYTPNYPAIPGVANSFPPGMASIGGPFLPPYTATSNDPTPTIQPGVIPTGTTADYNYYYDRDTNNPTGPPTAFTNPFSSPSAPQNEFYNRMMELNRTLPAGPYNIYDAFGSGLIAAPRQNQAAPRQNQALPLRFGGGARAFQPPIGTRPDSRDQPAQAATSNVDQGGQRRRNNGFTLSPSESVMSRHLNDNTATEFVPSTASSTVGYGFNYPHDGSGASEIFGRYPI